MSEALVTLVGNIASDVRTNKSQRGTVITSFRFAQTPRRIDRNTGRWGDGPTSFFGVTCWRTLAEHGEKSLHKGDPVIVVGRLRIRDWKDDNGRMGRDAEVDAITVGHDLVRGTSEFTRVRRERTEQGDEGEFAAAVSMELLVEEQARAAGEIRDPEDEPEREPDREAVPSVFGARDEARTKAA
ncbi:MAG: single-stranded DNA-binding protein [Jiangellaceae bacterium]